MRKKGLDDGVQGNYLLRMTHTKFPSGLSEISSDYDLLLCDVWGVVHNGRAPFDEACEALIRFRGQGGRVVLITNAPVPSFQVMSYAERIGVPSAISDACVSSGDATREILAGWVGRRIYIMGTDNDFEHDNFLYKGLDLEFGDEGSSDAVLCIGMRNPREDHPESYRDELERLAGRELPMICANPDIQVRVGDRLWWCAGALAQIYEELGGEVIYPGKPHEAIYSAAFARANSMGEEITKERTLVIGDSPKTDLEGGRRQGIDALYVGTGLTVHQQGDFADETRAMLNEHAALAKYAMPALTW